MSKQNVLKADKPIGAVQEKLLKEKLVKLKQQNCKKFHEELIALSQKYNCKLIPIVKMDIDGQYKQIAVQDLLKIEVDMVVVSN